MLAGDYPIAVTGDFASGERYALVRDLTHNCYLVEDRSGDVVALVPLSANRDTVISQGRFRIASAQLRRSWRVEASRAGFRAPVATARPTRWPRRYRLWCDPGRRYGLRRSRLGGTWKLRAGLRRVALIRLTGGLGAVDERQSERQPRRKIGSLVTLSASANPAPQLGLLLTLALETVRADGATSGAPSVGY